MNDAVAAIERRWKRPRFTVPCGVCLGHSPSWDGHAPGCERDLMSHAHEDIEMLLRAYADAMARAEGSHD